MFSRNSDSYYVLKVGLRYLGEGSKLFTDKITEARKFVNWNSAVKAAKGTAFTIHSVKCYSTARDDALNEDD